MGTYLTGTYSVIHTIGDADFDNFVYSSIYFNVAGAFIINGIVVIGVADKSVDIIVNENTTTLSTDFLLLGNPIVPQTKVKTGLISGDSHNEVWEFVNIKNGLSTISKNVSPKVSSFTNTYSLDFDGVDDYVSAGDILNTSNTGSDAFSMSCWFKTIASGGDYYLIGKAKNSSQLDGYHFFINSSGQIRFFLGRYTGTAATSPWIYVRTTTTWNDGNWHNVVLTYNGNQNTSGLTIYVDGNSQSLTALYNNTPSINSTDSEFIVGALGKSGDIGGLFSGEIDEASYFNSELTSEDVTAIYNSGSPTDLTDLSPVAWYRMGDNGSYKSPQWLLPNNENKDKVSNYSFGFDAVDDYIELGSLSNLQNATEYSISSWFKSPLNNFAQTIYSWADGADGYLQLVLVDDGSFSVYNYRTSTAYGLSATGVVSANTWYNATVVFDGGGVTNADRLKLYINGSLITLTYTGTIPTQTGTMLSKTMWLGASNSSNFWGLEGNIDELSIFDSAISIADVWDGSGEPIDVSTVSGLKQYYKMGEEANFTSNWLVDNSALDNYSKRSFEFDGIGDYVDCGDSDDFSFGNGTNDSPFSISAWINMDDATKFRIASKNSGTLKEYIFTTSSTKLLSFVLYSLSTGNRIQRKYNTALTSYEGQWVNVAATYDGSSSSSGIKLYLNGARVDDIDGNAGSYIAMENTSQSLEIGRDSLTSFANGKIDEVSVFNIELSASDITDIYNGGQPTTLPSGAVAHYKMGEDASFNGANWTIPDQVGTNNGTSDGMMVDALVGEAPNYSGGGISEGMDIEDRVGEAPKSENNALSYNMEREYRVEDTP